MNNRTDQTDPLQSGPQDCGTFFLDAVGPYSRDRVTVTWSDETRPTTEQVEQFIETFWRRLTDAARTDDTILFNGPLCRLVDYQVAPDRLSLTLGPTDYRTFIGTNLHNAHLRYSHGPEMLANPVGVSAVVITRGDYIVMGRRSRKVAYHAERIHPAGGCVEPPTGDGRRPDPFATVVTELNEELGLTADQVSHSICLGLIRDKHIVQPELIFDVSVDATVDEIRTARHSATSEDEHSELLVLRDHPAGVVAFMEMHAAALTPVAMASLLLHGLHHWGGGWFASTRGYLRSLI